MWFFFFLLLGIVIWVAIRFSSLSEKVEDLLSRVMILEEDRKEEEEQEEEEQEEEEQEEEEQEEEEESPLKIPETLPEEPKKPKVPLLTPKIPEPTVKPQKVVLPSEPEPSPSWEFPRIDWEKFMGVKLFAWLGGFALFLGISFFMKYSIDRGWISPLVRVMMAFLVGVGVIWGGLRLRFKGYPVTVQTLCASGISILYADIYACRAFYNFFSTEVAFAFMILVTIVSFLLSVRLDSKFVAILGLISGFLTPLLLSTGVDRPFTLFGYLLILDGGLASIAIKKRWGFLVVMTAIATFLMELVWTAKFFKSDKIFLAIGIYLLFPVFYSFLSRAAKRFQYDDPQFHWTAGFYSLGSIGFVVYMLTMKSLGAMPGVVLGFLFSLNLILTYLAFFRDENKSLHLAGGIVTFFLLYWWTVRYLNPGILPWGLSFYLAFSILHSILPILLLKTKQTGKTILWGSFSPLFMLFMILIGVLVKHISSFQVWPVIFLLGLLASMVSWFTSLLWIALGSLILTLASLWIWIFRLPQGGSLLGTLVLIGFFSLFYYFWGLFLSKKWTAFPKSPDWNPDIARFFPSLSALLPFLLLAMASDKLPLQNPSPIFWTMSLLILMLFGLVLFRDMEVISLIVLGATALVEWVWHTSHFNKVSPLVPFLWYQVFYILFMVFPFLFKKMIRGKMPWIASAFSGPVQFFLVYDVISKVFGKSYIGLIPLAFALVSLSCLFEVRRSFSKESYGSSLLAYFGGVSLFFITLTIPLQFEREWLTLGWVLEGVALLWLYHRVNHPGLQTWGLSLLFISFVRLALNPSVLSYHPRAPWPVLNWYLYVYGIASLSFWVASKLSAPPRDRWFTLKIPGILNGLGAVLAFLLLNIEIADYYSTGRTITFNFSGSFAQDLTYSLAWSLFAFVLLIIGIQWRNIGSRYGSLVLLSFTILKVFLHDLWRLGQLYRVGSIIGLAAVLILVSFLYQRYLKGVKSHA